MPPCIPGPEWQGLAYRPAFDNVVRSQMIGGRRERRRFTWVPEILSCTLYLTPAQLEVLLDFHDITCAGGSRPFRWWDWRRPSDTDKRALYSFESRPTYTTWADIWCVELQLLVRQTVPGTYALGDGSGGVLTTDEGQILTT